MRFEQYSRNEAKIDTPSLSVARPIYKAKLQPLFHKKETHYFLGKRWVEKGSRDQRLKPWFVFGQEEMAKGNSPHSLTQSESLENSTLKAQNCMSFRRQMDLHQTCPSHYGGPSSSLSTCFDAHLLSLEGGLPPPQTAKFSSS